MLQEAGKLGFFSSPRGLCGVVPSPGAAPALTVVQGWARFLLCHHRFPAICLPCPHPPKNHIFLHPSSSVLGKNGLEVHRVSWAGGAGCSLHPKPAILEQLWLRPAHGAPSSHKPKPALNPSNLLLRSHQRLRQVAWLRPVLGKDGNSFPWLSQQWLKDAMRRMPTFPVPLPSRSGCEGILSTCG